MHGTLRVPEKQYKYWSFRQFNAALSAHYETVEARERQEWERVRWQTAVLINIQLDKKDKLNDVTKLLSLPWDEKKPVSIKPTAQQEELWRKMEQYLNENL